MVEAAERAGVVLLVGHSHSHDLPIRRMRDLITSGEYGAARMVHSWCYTDWVRRPRRAAELDPALGGGVTFRQGAHQFDIIRLLCGGLARSVRARTFDWDAERRTVGAHSVWLEFDDASATAVYSGYGHFATPELYGGIGEWGTPPQAAVPSGPASGQSELAAKRERARSAIPTQAPHQPFFGLTVVSCEHGVLRQSPDGIYVYGKEGRREVQIAPELGRAAELVELHDAITQDRPAVLDAAWGMATLEVCVAILDSARERREVMLRHQSPTRDIPGW
jgi:phthalate 4,5-cis-dihydrodiol dehydrogenase